MTLPNQIRAQLRESEQRHRLVLDTLSEGVVKQRADGSITMCNAAAERILGLTKDQMVGRSSYDPRWRAVHEDGSPYPGDTHPAALALQTGEDQNDVVMGVHKPSGDLTWVLINARPLTRPGETKPYAVVSSFADITTLKAAEAKLRHAAVHDALTGLPLRTLFTDRLEQVLVRKKHKPEHGVAVLFLDLDGFKRINDTLGHAAGDDLLVTVAERLKRAVRASDTVARLSGDEFAVLLDGFADAEDALALVARLVETLTFNIDAGSQQLPVGVSVGVTFLGVHADATRLLQEADAAMYRAKAAGKGRYIVAE